MSDKVNRPEHYRKGRVECIDAIKSALGDGYRYYLQGSILNICGDTSINIAIIHWKT